MRLLRWIPGRVFFWLVLHVREELSRRLLEEHDGRTQDDADIFAHRVIFGSAPRDTTQETREFIRKNLTDARRMN